MNRRGVIYYNTGTSCAVRLLVSLASLRRHYQGPVTILSEGAESHPLCERISQALSAEFREWDCGVPPGANRTYLAKTRYHLGTPYQTSVALDSDTLVIGPIDDLFSFAEESSFAVAQLASWTTSGRIISSRLKKWEHLLPDDYPTALAFGPAINCGVLAFTRDAPLFNHWYESALQGREYFIPDEVSCQMILHRYPHRILDGRWNRSCKHDDANLQDTRVIHYHGRKHCRPGLPYHGDLWFSAFTEAFRNDLAQVTQWSPSGDRMLRRYLLHHSSVAEDSATQGRRARQEIIRQQVVQAVEVQLVLGARKTCYEGWVSTDRDTLDVTRVHDWVAILQKRKVSRLLAEHVWEHLSESEMQTANQLAFEHLAPGGCLRIAVPDGLCPNKSYIARVRPGGSGPSAQEHQQLLNYKSLSDSLRVAGFNIQCLEYWDEHGEFHYRPWSSAAGHIKRSLRFDRRNRHGRLNYTSLIIDATKPAITYHGSESPGGK